MIVVDASVLVASLTDTESDGEWAEEVVSSGTLVAPHLVLAETTNILRRLRTAGKLGPDEAGGAFRDLMDLPLDHQPFEPFAERVWELKDNVTSYDAWYVVVAEAFALPLATLDGRLARASGIHCEILTPVSGP